MKKISLLLSSAAVLLFGACKEKGPDIDFGKLKVSDTTYTSSTIEAPQAKYVLVEEFTGATCTNCPAARTKLATISAANNNRLIVMGIHPKGIGQAEPVPGIHRHDFRTDIGTTIQNVYYSTIQGIPAAGFDRTMFNGERILTTEKWANPIETRLALKTPLNISIVSNYDQSKGAADIQVKVVYTEDVEPMHNLSVAIIEDSIVDAQEFPFSAIDTNYMFMHVFRDLLTSAIGKPYLENLAKKEKGRVFIRTYYNYKLNPDWNPNHCKVIAFVHNGDGDNKEVIQVAEADLKP
jgi:hypothetical protein